MENELRTYQEALLFAFLLNFQVSLFSRCLRALNGLGVSEVKVSACNAGDLGSIPGERNGNPLQYSCLESPRGWRSFAGYSPRGHKESDTTELSLSEEL